MKSFVGVTKCPVGVAHTYMAAEKLQKVGEAQGYQVKVETQGATGVEDGLTAADIQAADFVIVAADVEIDGENRFNGKKVLHTTTAAAIKDAGKLVADAQQLQTTQTGATTTTTTTNSNDPQQSPIVKQLLNGVSHMIPFVVVGGLFIALSIAIGGHPTANGMVIPKNTIWSAMNQIGSIGFQLMIPILAGYIAYAIAGRAALAPAMISAMVANTPAILGTKSGTGFIGAILVGFAAGYLVKWINTWPIPKDLRPIMPIFVIPLLGTGVITAVLILFLGAPIAWLMTSLQDLLTFLSKNPSTSIVLGLVLGAMIGVDMGGAVNKVAFLFGVASITAGHAQIMGAVAAAIAVPPFATANPKQVIPSVIIGSAVAGAFGMLFKITDAVPHGGPIVGVLGATNHLLLYLLAILIGVAVAVALLTVFKIRHAKKQAITAK